MNYRRFRLIPACPPSDPDAWVNDYPLCGGFYQSPIALQSANHYLGQTTDPEKLGYVNYDFVPENMFIQNNGAGCKFCTI